MGEVSAISWTDSTFNPWIGCTKVSPGCDHCYAEALRKRTGQDEWGNDVRTVTGDAYWRNPHKWNAAAEKEGMRRRVFCASLADVFEDRAELVPLRKRLFDTITATPWLDWQLLTKRPENVLRLVDGWVLDPERPDDWPENVGIGTTVEDQERADLRVPLIVAIPARVRFLSVEPMLGPVDLAAVPLVRDARSGLLSDAVDGIDWVICGGESGAHHRPLNLDWARSLRDQCAVSDVAYWFKQVSGSKPGLQGPPDLQVKEFPRANESATSPGPRRPDRPNP